MSPVVLARTKSVRRRTFLQAIAFYTETDQHRNSWMGEKLENRIDLDKTLSRCREGDQLAWELLVRTYQSKVFAITYSYLDNREEARDLTQEVFVRVYQNLEVCVDGKHFLPWIIRISRNACIDQIRRRKARPPAQDVDAGELRNLSGKSPSPEENLEKKSKRRLLQKALRSLTELNREIILLKEIQGLSLEEISSLLGVPLGTLKSRSHRARIELARSLLSLADSGATGS